MVASLLFSTSLLAAEPATEHTFKLAPGETAPNARLSAAAWLAGQWRGRAFGKPFEETWNPPSADSMVGMMKLFDESGVVDFYELMTLREEAGSLVLNVKHFDANLHAWETKEEMVKFRLVAVESDALHFDGVSFYRRNADHIDAFLVMDTQDGPVERLIQYSRVDPHAE